MKLVSFIMVWAMLFLMSYNANANAFFSAFVAGTIGFWSLTGLVFILLFAFVDNEEGAAATLTVVSFAALLQLFGDLKPFTFIRENPLYTAKLLVGWFVAGTLWSIVKWWFYVREERERYEEAKVDFLEHEGYTGTEVPDSLKAKWKRTNPIDLPQVKYHKEAILRWMTFWLWSLIWTIINDPIKKLFKAIFRRITNLLQWIANRAFAGTEKDFK